MSDKLDVGTLFAHFGKFHCKGLSEFERPKKNTIVPPALPLIYSKRGEIMPNGIVALPYHPEHLTSQSSRVHLTGCKRLFVLGVITSKDENQIEGIPYVIGSLVMNLFTEKGPFLFWPTRFAITIDEVDSFLNVRAQRPPSLQEIEALRRVPEEAIKETVAQILGEPFVPKDWAGERSDLFTSRIVLKQDNCSVCVQRPLSAVDREMVMAGLSRMDVTGYRAAEKRSLMVEIHRECNRI